MKKQPGMPAVARIMVQATRSADHERLLPTMSGHKSPTPARDCTGRAPWAGTVLTLLALQLGFGLWLMPAAYSRCARATTARSVYCNFGALRECLPGSPLDA